MQVFTKMELSSLDNKQTNHYEYVFKNKIESDIQFVVRNNNEETVIKGHKQILGPLNPFFLDIFISQPELKKIEILDLDPEAFRVFIDYLYTGKVSDENISEELFRVAHRYVDPTLKNICRKKLGTNFNTENVARRLLTFFNCKETKLLRAACMFLVRNYNDVKSRFDFKQIVENPAIIDVIFDMFDECNVTVLTEEVQPDRQALIDSATKSDLTIKVQNDLFLAHKNILSSRNALFKTTVSKLPSTRNVSSSICITHSEASIFKIFLLYIYTRQVEDKNTSKELLEIAHKYDDVTLKGMCQVHLLTTLSEKNAVELLSLGTDLDCKALKDRAAKFIADRYAEIKNQDEFKLVKQNDAAVEAIFSHFADKIDGLYRSLTFYQRFNSYEGKFLLTAPTIACQSTCSEPFYMSNMAWRVVINLQSKDNVKGVRISLRCYRADNSESFSQNVNYSIELISSVNKLYNISYKSTNLFSVNETKESTTWGWVFVTLSELHDRKKGFVTNRKMSVRINAKVVE